METFTWKSLIKGTINRIFDRKVSVTEKGGVTETNFCRRTKFKPLKKVFVRTKIYVNKIMFFRKQVSITEKKVLVRVSVKEKHICYRRKKICHRFFSGQKSLSKKKNVHQVDRNLIHQDIVLSSHKEKFVKKRKKCRNNSITLFLMQIHTIKMYTLPWNI